MTWPRRWRKSKRTAARSCSRLAPTRRISPRVSETRPATSWGCTRSRARRDGARMKRFYTSRRLLGIPAWLWLIVPVPLLALGNVLWKGWPPGQLTEPAERGKFFREPALLARDGESFRFVPFGE